MQDNSKGYNKGNDCDCCDNQYLCGRDGDAVGCRCQDISKECKYIPVHCDFCDSFAKEELICEKLGYSATSNSVELCWEWYRERHEDCPFNPQKNF